MSTRQPLYTAITKGKQTADQSQSSTDVSSKIKVADTPTTLTSSHHGEYSGAINVNFKFNSREQATAVARILHYQKVQLEEQAKEKSKEQYPYIADMLLDCSNLISNMVNAIEDQSSK